MNAKLGHYAVTLSLDEESGLLQSIAVSPDTDPAGLPDLHLSGPASSISELRLRIGEDQRRDLRLDTGRLRGFQTAVFNFLLKHPGVCFSYGEVAKALGKPGAARAVGQALHHNPFAIVLPCHRVIRSDGSLGGYAYGLAVKRALLRDEGLLDKKRL